MVNLRALWSHISNSMSRANVSRLKRLQRTYQQRGFQSIVHGMHITSVGLDNDLLNIPWMKRLFIGARYGRTLAPSHIHMSASASSPTLTRN